MWEALVMMIGETLAVDCRKLRAPKEVGVIPGAVGTTLIYSYTTNVVPKQTEATIETGTNVNETERSERGTRVSGTEGLAFRKLLSPEYKG